VLLRAGAASAAIRELLLSAGLQAEVRTEGGGRWWRGWDALVLSEDQAASVLEALGPDLLSRTAPAVVVVCDPGREAAGLAMVGRGAADYLLSDRLARLPLALAAARQRTTLMRRVHELELTLNAGHELIRRGFDASTSALIVTDGAGRIAAWNRTAERALGWSEEEVRGIGLAELITAGSERSALTAAIDDALVAELPQEERRTLMVRGRNGATMLSEMKVTRLVSGGVPSVVVSLTAADAGWRLDIFKERQLGVLTALSSASDTAALAGVLQQVALSADGEQATLWECGPRGYRRLAEWSSPSIPAAVRAAEVTLPPTLVEKAIASAEITLAEPDRASGGPDVAGLHMAIPLIHGSQALGAVEVCGTVTPGVDEYLLVHLRAVAGHLATYLARRRSEADFARSLDELQRLERERRRLMRLLVEVHEDERRAIAADIHDDPLQSLAAIALRLHTLRRRIADPSAQRTLDSVEDMVRSTVARMRSLMFNLCPPALDRGDLLGALRERLDQLRDDPGLEYSLTAGEPLSLTADTRVVLFRVAQEALANVVRHASASRVDVTLENQREGCLLRIADDGVGIQRSDQAVRPPHMGLHIMRERVELARGWLRVEPGGGAGTVVEAWVPAQLGEPLGGAAA
jgi:PAS domain S-box-containing protein